MQYNSMLLRDQITKDYYNQAIALEEQLYQKQLFDASSWGQVMQSGISSLESAMSNFLDYSSDRFLKFGDLAVDVLNQIYKALIREFIISQMILAVRGMVSSFFGGVANSSPGVIDTGSSSALAPAFNLNYSGVFANAKGNVLSSPDLHKYVNSVVSKPTYFKFASGGIPSLGVMGEKNGGSPEAIMPLTRTSNGDLGAKAEVANTPNNMRIEIINQTKEDVKVTNVNSRQNLEEQVISIVIGAVRTNKGGMREILGGNI